MHHYKDLAAVTVWDFCVFMMLLPAVYVTKIFVFVYVFKFIPEVYSASFSALNCFLLAFILNHGPEIIK